MKMGSKERAGFESGLCEGRRLEEIVGGEIKLIVLSEHVNEVKYKR
jgi:hypothetical protein